MARCSAPRGESQTPGRGKDPTGKRPHTLRGHAQHQSSSSWGIEENGQRGPEHGEGGFVAAGPPTRLCHHCSGLSCVAGPADVLVLAALSREGSLVALSLGKTTSPLASTGPCCPEHHPTSLVATDGGTRKHTGRGTPAVGKVNLTTGGSLVPSWGFVCITHRNVRSVTPNSSSATRR